MTTKTILVVDDEMHVSHVVSGKLRQAGLNVLCAADGEEALEIATRDGVDLVVTDFQMPVMSGLELCMRLKEYAGTAQVPVIMVSARGHLLTDEDLARTNIRAVMCKPFAPRHLVEKVQELLGAGGAASQAGARAA
ncbi:MAG TPA: response regulator [Phycisphaerales bacterium]|nr:response regulator [Phycisphaerales bacterium]